MSTPTVFAASRMDVPSGTDAARPSIVSEMVFTSAMSTSCRRCARERTGDRNHAATGRNLRLEFVAEFLEARHHRRCARIAEHANGFARHVVGDRKQCVEIFCGAFAIANAFLDARCPCRAFPTLRALCTALVCVESCESRNQSHHVLPVVEHNDTTGAKHGANLHKPFVVHHRTLGFVAREDWHRRTTWND